MSLEVHLVKRKVLAGKDAGKEKYYGQVRMRQTVSLKQLSRRVAADASATPGDVEMVINSMVDVLVEALEMGNTVDLGDFGNMRLTASSKGAATKDEYKGWMMHSPRILFTPGKTLQHMLDDVKFSWMAVEYGPDCDDDEEPNPFPQAPLNPPQGGTPKESGLKD